MRKWDKYEISEENEAIKVDNIEGISRRRIIEVDVRLIIGYSSKSNSCNVTVKIRE